MTKLNIAVLYGGKSVEHEVSVHSAGAVCEILGQTHNILPIFINKSGQWFLQQQCGYGAATDVKITKEFKTLDDVPLGVDVVFPVLHGANGEDGTLQGLLEMLNIPYVGCGVLASAAGMDKEITKILAERAGVPVLPWVRVEKAAFDINAVKKQAAALGYPVFVKPVSLGSSVGVSKVHGEAELQAAFDNAFNFERMALMERGVERAREVFCAVYGAPGEFNVSETAELNVVAGEFFDYHAKYETAGGCEVRVPAGIPAKTQEEIKNYTRLVFNALRGAGLARADFLLGADGQVYFSEINTLPGMSETSLFPQMCEASGRKYEDVLLALIDVALKIHAEKF